MLDQWALFQHNLGIWQGSFATFNHQMQLKHIQPSELTLALAPTGRSIELSLLFWPEQKHQPVALPMGAPAKRISQSFTNLPSELCFFPTGTFCRGTLFIASARQAWSCPYAEFGFLHGQRRHRLVLLWDGAGQLDRIVLIREFLAGSSAVECPALQADDLIGDWRHDLPSPGDHIHLAADDLDQWIFLPDGGAFLAPAQIDPSKPFSIEALWLSSSTRLERISRRYSEHGALTSVDHQLLTR